MIDDQSSNCAVLLVRTHSHVRISDSKQLASGGLSVLQAWSTDYALSYLESRSDIRVVICDSDMPGSLNGIDLADFIGRRWPHIKVVMTHTLFGFLPTQASTGALTTTSPSSSNLLHQVLAALAGK